MPVHRFVCAENERYGGTGWRLTTQPNFDPLSGLAVAHDILEHLPGGDESPADEFQAFGGILYVRLGEHGYLELMREAESFAFNFEDVWDAIVTHSLPIKMPPEHLPVVPENVREMIRAIQSHIYPANKETFERHGGDPRIRQMIRSAPGWMTIGYARTERRYRHAGPYQMKYMFEDIVRRADKALNYAEVGDYLRVQVYHRDGYADVQFREAYSREYTLIQ